MAAMGGTEARSAFIADGDFGCDGEGGDYERFTRTTLWKAILERSEAKRSEAARSVEECSGAHRNRESSLEPLWMQMWSNRHFLAGVKMCIIPPSYVMSFAMKGREGERRGEERRGEERRDETRTVYCLMCCPPRLPSGACNAGGCVCQPLPASGQLGLCVVLLALLSCFRWACLLRPQVRDA